LTRVQLPDGCYGLDMANGKKYTADKPGGQVEVTERDSKYIGTSWYGQTGVMSGSQTLSFGTKRGRWCWTCRRLWNNWTTSCHKCGELTEPEWTGGEIAEFKDRMEQANRTGKIKVLPPACDPPHADWPALPDGITITDLGGIQETWHAPAYQGRLERTTEGPAA
jgi:hypothetical protein